MFKLSSAIVAKGAGRTVERKPHSGLMGNVTEFIEQSKKFISILNEDIKKGNEILNQIAADSSRYDVMRGEQDKEIENIESQLEGRLLDDMWSARLVDDRHVVRVRNDGSSMSKGTTQAAQHKDDEEQQEMKLLIKNKKITDDPKWQEMYEKVLSQILEQGLHVLRMPRKKHKSVSTVRVTTSKHSSLSTLISLAKKLTESTTTNQTSNSTSVPVHSFNISNICINLEEYCQKNETKQYVNKTLESLGLNTTVHSSATEGKKQTTPTDKHKSTVFSALEISHDINLAVEPSSSSTASVVHIDPNRLPKPTCQWVCDVPRAITIDEDFILKNKYSSTVANGNEICSCKNAQSAALQIPEAIQFGEVSNIIADSFDLSTESDSSQTLAHSAGDSSFYSTTAELESDQDHTQPSFTMMDGGPVEADTGKSHIPMASWQTKAWEPIGIGFGLPDLFNFVTLKMITNASFYVQSPEKIENGNDITPDGSTMGEKPLMLLGNGKDTDASQCITETTPSMCITDFSSFTDETIETVTRPPSTTQPPSTAPPTTTTKSTMMTTLTKKTTVPPSTTTVKTTTRGSTSLSTGKSDVNSSGIPLDIDPFTQVTNKSTTKFNTKKTTPTCVPSTCETGSEETGVTLYKLASIQGQRNLVEIFVTLPLYFLASTTKKKERFFGLKKYYDMAPRRQKLATTTQQTAGISSTIYGKNVLSGPKVVHHDKTKKPLEVFILDPDLALWKNGLK